MPPEMRVLANGLMKMIRPIAVRLARDAGDRREELLDLRFRQMARDEDEPRAAVIVGPVDQLDRTVRDMLHGVHDNRAAAALDRDEPFDAQQIGAAQTGQYRHRLLEHPPRQRLVEEQRKAVDAMRMRVRVIVLIYGGA